MRSIWLQHFSPDLQKSHSLPLESSQAPFWYARNTCLIWKWMPINWYIFLAATRHLSSLGLYLGCRVLHQILFVFIGRFDSAREVGVLVVLIICLPNRTTANIGCKTGGLYQGKWKRISRRQRRKIPSPRITLTACSAPRLTRTVQIK